MKTYILSLFRNHIGASNPITKKELVLKTGLDERAVRRYLKDLYRDGFMIIATSSGAGYYLSNDELEVNKFLMDMSSRRDRLNENINIARNWLSQRKSVIDIDVVMIYE